MTSKAHRRSPPTSTWPVRYPDLLSSIDNDCGNIWLQEEVLDEWMLAYYKDISSCRRRRMSMIPRMILSKVPCLLKQWWLSSLGPLGPNVPSVGLHNSLGPAISLGCAHVTGRCIRYPDMALPHPVDLVVGYLLFSVHPSPNLQSSPLSASLDPKKVSTKFRTNFTKFMIFGKGREYIISSEIFVKI